MTPFLRFSEIAWAGSPFTAATLAALAAEEHQQREPDFRKPVEQLRLVQ